MQRTTMLRIRARALSQLVWYVGACTTLQREVGDRFEDHTPSPWTSAHACEHMLPQSAWHAHATHWDLAASLLS